MSKRIELKDLDIYYGKFHAVKSVSMTIEPRAVTAFIGSSGCGKSTVLRSINRMHEVIDGAYVDGQVLLDGVDLYDKAVDPVRVRRHIGMVFQRPNPFPTMSIRASMALADSRIGAGTFVAISDWAVARASSGLSSSARLSNTPNGSTRDGNSFANSSIAMRLRHPSNSSANEASPGRPIGRWRPCLSNSSARSGIFS